MDGFSFTGIPEWFDKRTFDGSEGPLESLLGRKTGLDVSIGVCLPALDEEETVGPICEAIVSDLVEPGFIDKLVVIDSGSSDGTASRAAAAGAEVSRAADILPDAPPLERAGKGESLWKSLAVVDTDIVVWLDSDTRNFTSSFVTKLVAPLLEDLTLVFTKAFYDRPIHGGAGLLPMGGARVTELSVRPLINLLYPELAGFIQPLSGEYAGRRDALIDIPFGTGYDVDLLMLIELVERHQLDALAQVELGSRVHRNRDIPALGRMSFEIIRALLERLDEGGRLKLAEEMPEALTQFTDEDASRQPVTYIASSERRPPMRGFLTS